MVASSVSLLVPMVRARSRTAEYSMQGRDTAWAVVCVGGQVSTQALPRLLSRHVPLKRDALEWRCRRDRVAIVTWGSLGWMHPRGYVFGVALQVDCRPRALASRDGASSSFAPAGVLFELRMPDRQAGNAVTPSATVDNPQASGFRVCGCNILHV